MGGYKKCIVIVNTISNNARKNRIKNNIKGKVIANVEIKDYFIAEGRTA